jgi:16S rRNA (guanine(966)-N(2))-methyltransferase RsmD
VRAAVFSMIGPEAVESAGVLDLYAGTGALGIEALSRGAGSVDFVESDASRCRDLRANLATLGLAKRGRVHAGRVERAMSRLDGSFGLVLIDPPYDADPWDGVMTQLDEGGMLGQEAIVVAEHSSRRKLAPAYGGLVRARSRRYGDTSVSVYSLRRDE